MGPEVSDILVEARRRLVAAEVDGQSAADVDTGHLAPAEVGVDLVGEGHGLRDALGDQIQRAALRPDVGVDPGEPWTVPVGLEELLPIGVVLQRYAELEVAVAVLIAAISPLPT